MSKPNKHHVAVGQVWQRKPGKELTSGGVHFHINGLLPGSQLDFVLVPCRLVDGRWVRGAKDSKGRKVRETRKWTGSIQRDMVHVTDNIILVEEGAK